MSHLFKRLNIEIKTVAQFHHQSLQAEHGIKSLSSILPKHLTEQGQMWPKFLPLATLAYNTFNSPNLANHSPYELKFRRKPKILLDFGTDPDTKISGVFTEYYKLLEKRIKYLQDTLQQFKSKCLAMINKNHKSCSKLVISVTEHLVEVVDKLSTTAVVFFRSERILKCKCLYGS